MSEAYPLEVIHWIDSCGTNGWNPPFREHVLAECVSVGWVTYEDSQLLTIVSHRQHNPDESHHSAMSIPKVAITKREPITVKRKKTMVNDNPVVPENTPCVLCGEPTPIIFATRDGCENPICFECATIITVQQTKAICNYVLKEAGDE